MYFLSDSKGYDGNSTCIIILVSELYYDSGELFWCNVIIIALQKLSYPKKTATCKLRAKFGEKDMISDQSSLTTFEFNVVYAMVVIKPKIKKNASEYKSCLVIMIIT